MSGRIMPWEFVNGERHVQLHVQGRLILNDAQALADAALEGHGIAYVAEHFVARHVASGDLVHVLPEWGATLPGFHLYYPSRRQPPAAFNLLIEAMRCTA